jgi:hypothetical protein
MEFLNTIKNHILQLDTKTFFAYVGGFLLGMLFIMGGLYYYYYDAIDDLTAQIEELNGKREKIRKLLERKTRLEQQEIEVNKLLKEDPNFIIGDYFNQVINKLKLTLKEPYTVSETPKLEGKYQEYTLPARFEAIDMKQICELLEDIENNKRVYTKSLEIVRSGTVPTKLDVTLTIGTLLNKIPGT